LYHYEESHSDALRPNPQDADKLFLNEHNEMLPSLRAEFQQMLTAHTKLILDSLAPVGASPSSDIRNTRDDYPNPCPPPEAQVPPMDMIDTLDYTAGPTAIPTVGPSSSTPNLQQSLKLCIPSMARTCPVHLRWKQIISDWERPDPSRGLHTALKDWDPEWITGDNRTTFGMKYHHRKLIALEYIDG
jgi:hypothetical protein